MIISKLQDQGKAYSRLAGMLYLAIAIVGGFSIGYMPSVIVVDGNATLTLENLINHQGIFKMGIAGDIFVLVVEVVLTVMLQQMFKRFSKTGITIATFSRIAMTIIVGMNLVNYVVPAIIMTQPDYLSAFGAGELEELTLLFFKIHKAGEMAWQVFFAIHLFALGYVIHTSKKAPKWLGGLMLIGGVGYAGDCITQLTLMNSEVLSVVLSSLLVLAVIAKLWFAFWLLIKGGITEA